MPENQILTIDIGGSHIKATILNQAGELQVDYRKVTTPSPATPAAVIAAIIDLVSDFPNFNFISVGFPGFIRNGHVMTAPNLNTSLWHGLDLCTKLAEAFDKPVRIVNDADLQGLGVVRGEGFEMVVTLGTGFGTALLQNGILLPHIELAHHPVTKSKTYDLYIGDRALESIGEDKWNDRMKRVLQILKTVFNYDYLYISGGNADLLSFPLDENITIVSNKDGIKGGARLWQDQFKI
ncbi:ROK family protein [Pontibacter chitinilyticus]|uniref:ROK family protein n=1 Tax=Pontibacter chitinilyticus TaxID=2674989 RepID=UPI00321A302B